VGEKSESGFRARPGIQPLIYCTFDGHRSAVWRLESGWQNSTLCNHGANGTPTNRGPYSCTLASLMVELALPKTGGVNGLNRINRVTRLRIARLCKYAKHLA